MRTSEAPQVIGGGRLLFGYNGCSRRESCGRFRRNVCHKHQSGFQNSDHKLSRGPDFSTTPPPLPSAPSQRCPVPTGRERVRQSCQNVHRKSASLETAQNSCKFPVDNRRVIKRINSPMMPVSKATKTRTSHVSHVCVYLCSSELTGTHARTHAHTHTHTHNGMPWNEFV